MDGGETNRRTHLALNCVLEETADRSERGAPMRQTTGPALRPGLRSGRARVRRLGLVASLGVLIHGPRHALAHIKTRAVAGEGKMRDGSGTHNEHAWRKLPRE